MLFSIVQPSVAQLKKRKNDHNSFVPPSVAQIPWTESGPGDSPKYESKEGAGHFSREYSKQRIIDVKKTGKPTDDSDNIK